MYPKYRLSEWGEQKQCNEIFVRGSNENSDKLS
jgi:hypothetical protein